MPGLKLLERAHRLTERLEVLLRRHLLSLCLLREGLAVLVRSARLLKAKQRAVVGINRRAALHDDLVPMVAVAPGVLEKAEELIAGPPTELNVSVRVSKLAARLIELRFEFNDTRFERAVFDDPRVKELRELLARELGALQERQRQ
jgi:hypothetical protein